MGIDALYTTVGLGSALGCCPHVRRAMQGTFASHAEFEALTLLRLGTFLAEMFATVRQFSDLKISFTQLALDPNGNDVAALLTCELPLLFFCLVCSCLCSRRPGAIVARPPALVSLSLSLSLSRLLMPCAHARSRWIQT